VSDYSHPAAARFACNRRFAAADAVSPAGDMPIYLLIYACVLENPVLALVNNYAFILNSQIVAAVQLAITLAVIVAIAVRRPCVGWQFVAAVGLFLFCTLVKFLYTGLFDPRFLYDASILPMFLLLGTTARRFSPAFLGSLLVVLALGAALELVFPELYTEVFNPRKYFYFTREWVAAVTEPTSSILTSADIYLGSTRTGGSFFGALHRAGSLFLEPLSLGYFGAIAAVFAVHAPGLRRRSRAFLLLCCLFLAVASDTRVAVFLILATIALHRVLAKVPRIALYISPYFLVMAVVLLYFSTTALQGDLNLRLGVTMVPLLNGTAGAILFGGIDATKAVDSGIVYLIANAGLAGYCLYPSLASGLLLNERGSQAVSASILLYLFVGLVFGYAPMSIKTAAILGYGVATLGRAGEGERHPSATGAERI
jgi:putative polymerase